jgi:hypothetical protein
MATQKDKKKRAALLALLVGGGALYLLTRKKSGDNESGADNESGGNDALSKFPLLQNNNPLAIMRSNITWNGESPNNNNPTWEAFISLPYGWRATRINSNAIIDSFGGSITLGDFIHVWAMGASGDRPYNYINFVENESGYSADTLIYSNPKIQIDFMWPIYRAMAIYESGAEIRSIVDDLKPAMIESNNL